MDLGGNLEKKNEDQPLWLMCMKMIMHTEYMKEKETDCAKVCNIIDSRCRLQKFEII